MNTLQALKIVKVWQKTMENTYAKMLKKPIKLDLSKKYYKVMHSTRFNMNK